MDLLEFAKKYFNLDDPPEHIKVFAEEVSKMKPGTRMVVPFKRMAHHDPGYNPFGRARDPNETEIKYRSIVVKPDINELEAFMDEHGLGPEDMANDVRYPNG